MKKLLFIALLALTATSCDDTPNIEVGQKTTMEITKMYNAGRVVKGEVINAKFKVKNTGKYPLVFGEVRPSCSCTVADRPTEPIQPGETGEIIAQVKTDRLTTSRVFKTVTVMTNTEPNVTILEIKATIK
ncbi:MAG: DUF1573 domain-containing protein [Flavobacteriales bacterium]|jgi:hypothetical protein|nr:DUF1573 domain-containing protein [Crocinitomicaceae bacterium]NBX79532.1 DUF1573 domain-containing protein [Flavobacteriales bacterium]NCA21001.1 DUF1573 domain-containing protein [Crocinitomicaceae bacterium]